MKRLLLLAVLSASGCRAIVELVESDPGDVAAPDASNEPDPRCRSWSYTADLFDPCAIPPPGEELELHAGSWTYDSNSGALTDPDDNASFPSSALIVEPDGIEVRVVSVERFTLLPGATLDMSGKRPLLLATWSTAEVDGIIDVTSHGGLPGAGANPELCPAITAGANNTEGGGGGGGGGFGIVGAPGGSGIDGAASGGPAGPASTTTALRGGCRGGTGGNTLAGSGGDGGGAVAIAAYERIDVTGTIVAGGAGGGRARGARSGGGGGGSGGFVGLTAPAIALGPTSVVAANGGGGGGGCDGSPAIDGEDAKASTIEASGGAGQGMGGSGGAGGVRNAAAKPGIAARRGGGGGGGGVGVVRIVTDNSSVDPSALISPEPQVL